MRIASSFLVLALGISACGDTTSTTVVHADVSLLDGSWSAADEVPGSSEQWALTVSGTSVTGTGSWTNEACCGGPLVITGNISNDTLHLDVSYFRSPVIGPQTDDPLNVDAVLTSQTELLAKFPGDGPPVRFLKQSGG